MADKKNPVSIQQNVWNDNQSVDNNDLNVEQLYNTTIQSAILQNHIGTGVIKESIDQIRLFDSLLQVGFLDGKILYCQNQPSDSKLGNCLKISLVDSNVSIYRKVKVAIFGIDVNQQLIFETFYFKANEIQITKKHYVNVLFVLINDMIGNTTDSLNLGGRLLIDETLPFEISRDPLISSQNLQPNIFFRDFYVEGNIDIYDFLQVALPNYDVNNIGIYTTSTEYRSLSINDITSQIGQKFLCTTNNVQKITLLLAAESTNNVDPDDFNWTGNLLFTVYPLQSSINCITDFTPNLDIDFEPSNLPLVQISLDYNSLQNQGIVLSDTPQPVDFILSTTDLGNGIALEQNKYYVFTLKRVGNPNNTNIRVYAGQNLTPNSRMTLFGGSIWVDIPEVDLWHEVYSDKIKISDGQGYENGQGLLLPKTKLINNVETDYIKDDVFFLGSQVYQTKLYGKIEEFDQKPNQITGTPETTRKKVKPEIELLNLLEVEASENEDNLYLAAIADKNKKLLAGASIFSTLYSATIFNDFMMIRIVDDSTDTIRSSYQTNLLMSYLLNGDLYGSKIYPDSTNTSIYYRIGDAKLSSMIIGDINGDGIVDESDLYEIPKLYDTDLNISPSAMTNITTDNITTTYTNGYQFLTNPYDNQTSILFQLIDQDGYVVVYEGDGIIVPDPNNENLATFTCLNVNFNTIVGLSNYKLVVTLNTNLNNYGVSYIDAVDVDTDALTIRKVVLNRKNIGKLFRADINQDFHIDASDGYLLNSFVNKETILTAPNMTYPGPTTNPYTKIGTKFNVITISLEKFIDRRDDYFSGMTRADSLHTLPNVLQENNTLCNKNFYTNPTSIIINRNVIWEESLIICNNKAREVLTNYSSDVIIYDCNVNAISDSKYEDKPTFVEKKNNYYVPGDLIIKYGGQLKTDKPSNDSNYYKVDFEVGTITFEVPDTILLGPVDKSLNVLLDFIANYNDTGLTRAGYPAMRFADCSFVEQDALSKNQIRISVSVQSLSPILPLVSSKLGVYMDYETGILRLNYSGLFESTSSQALSTKIQINVFLKKAGFNNEEMFVDSTKINNMLTIISSFSGQQNLTSALLDLESQVEGILPIENGGTGLNSVGPNGSILVSNGTSLFYQTLSSSIIAIDESNGVSDAGKVVKTDGYGKIDNSFLIHPSQYIQMVTYSNEPPLQTNSDTPRFAGHINFSLDDYTKFGTVNSVYLELMINLEDDIDAYIGLVNFDDGYVIPIGPSGNDYITESFGGIYVKQSKDLKDFFELDTTKRIFSLKFWHEGSTSYFFKVFNAKLIINYS